MAQLCELRHLPLLYVYSAADDELVDSRLSVEFAAMFGANTTDAYDDQCQPTDPCSRSESGIKGSPYSITERKVPELIPVLGSWQSLIPMTNLLTVDLTSPHLLFRFTLSFPSLSFLLPPLIFFLLKVK